MHVDDLHQDYRPYYRFTGPQRIDRAIHTLEGIVCGIAADRLVNFRELAELTRWIGDHLEFVDRHPFNEVIPVLQNALADGVFDDEERRDLLWLCERISTGSNYFDEATSDMQRLQGILAGIVADSRINEQELRYLQTWIDEHQNLKTCWPYDEIESLLIDVMRDGVIDETEHTALSAFFSEFTSSPGSRSIASRLPEEMVSGLCAVCPDVIFAEQLFCFTGSSKRATREVMEAMTKERGGLTSRTVVRRLHYLVIGTDGNPCWTYACYGRKVEQAVELRREGLPVVLVHEYDFWDAIEDCRIGVEK